MNEFYANEQWKPVLNWEGLYEVSDQGRVRSMDRLVENKHGRKMLLYSRVLSSFPHNNGFWKVRLQERQGKQKHASIHLMVLEAFVGPRPPKMIGRHRNGKRYDNRLSNLCWGLRSNRV